MRRRAFLAAMPGLALLARLRPGGRAPDFGRGRVYDESRDFEADDPTWHIFTYTDSGAALTYAYTEYTYAYTAGSRPFLRAVR